VRHKRKGKSSYQGLLEKECGKGFLQKPIRQEKGRGVLAQKKSGEQVGPGGTVNKGKKVGKFFGNVRKWEELLNLRSVFTEGCCHSTRGTKRKGRSLSGRGNKEGEFTSNGRLGETERRCTNTKREKNIHKKKKGGWGKYREMQERAIGA